MNFQSNIKQLASYYEDKIDIMESYAVCPALGSKDLKKKIDVNGIV